MADEPKQKCLPLLIVKTGTIKRVDIKRAEKQGYLCIIESTAPEAVRFLDAPVPFATLDAQARASVELMRYIVHQAPYGLTRPDLVNIFVNALIGPNSPRRTEPVAQTAKIK